MPLAQARRSGYASGMFTGIVSDMGTIERLEDRGDLRARIRSAYPAAGIAIGASIACDGICLTVVDRGPAGDGAWFDVDISAETVARTNVRRNRGAWAEGRRVNLERALRLGDELGGHIVSGHVDGLAEIVALAPRGRQHPLQLPRPGPARPLHGAQGVGRAQRHLAHGERGRGRDLRRQHHPAHRSPSPPGARPRRATSSNLEIDTLARYVARLAEYAAA